MRSPVIAAFGAAMVLAVGVLGPGGMASGASSAGAGPDPADFTSPVPNAYFPLEPGMVSTYRGREGKDRLSERLTITDETKVIQGITTTVVDDVVYAKGGLVAEKTTDWYANDNDGNVWYFGEATATYDEHGNVITTEGSWEAGVDGAVAGTIMPADPMPTDAYRQEFSARPCRGPGLDRPERREGRCRVRETRSRRAQLRVDPPRAPRRLREVLRARPRDRPRRGRGGWKRVLRARGRQQGLIVVHAPGPARRYGPLQAREQWVVAVPSCPCDGTATRSGCARAFTDSCS